MSDMPRLHVRQLTASADYLSVADFIKPDGSYRQVHLVIAGLEQGVEVHNARGKEERVSVLSFQAVNGKPTHKRLVLIKDTIDTLGRLHGEWTDGWAGKAVTLYVEQRVPNPAGRGFTEGVRIRGQAPDLEALRRRAAAAGGQQAPQAEQQQLPEPDPDPPADAKPQAESPPPGVDGTTGEVTDEAELEEHLEGDQGDGAEGVELEPDGQVEGAGPGDETVECLCLGGEKPNPACPVHGTDGLPF